jgi:hypothetical protein
MQIFLMRNQDSVYFLVLAESEDEAKRKLEAWKPGTYAYAGETLILSITRIGPIAMVENHFMVRLPQLSLGLQTAQIEYSTPPKG